MLELTAFGSIEYALDAIREARLRAGGNRMLAALFVTLLPLPTLAQSGAVSRPPPGLTLPTDVAAPVAPERRPAFTFIADRREPEPLVLPSIKDSCAQENLNRNDEPLSQRIDCQGLGVPSGWFKYPSNAIRHPR